MVIDFSTLGVIKEQPTLVLCNADGKALQTLGYAFNLKADICYNEASTITFDIPAYVDGKATPHYDDIVGMRIIDMSGWGRFILMNPSANNNGVTEIKSCKAYSLEYELTYKKVFFDESTYNLWDPFAPDNTVLGMIMEDLPSWTIGHVDADLIGRYRTFSASNVNVYNFMKSTLQKSYGCIFDFDTYTRTINVRSTANEAISKPVYLSMENLVKEIEISEDTENIFTVLDVSGGEDVDIRSVNPLGTNKIYNLDYFMTPSYFDQAMIDKWNAWKKSFEAYQLTYYNISVERMLVASAITTEQAKLNDIQGSDLGTLLNERAVYVEYLAQLSDKDSTEYASFQSKLDDVNARIAVANQSVSEQESVIAELQSRSLELNEQLAGIKNAVSFSSVFTPSELIILDRYFKEESIEESTFVVSEVDSYSDENTSNAISKVNVKISDGQLSVVSSETSDMVYAIKGGNLSFTSNGTSLTAGVVKAHIERRTDGTFIMSAFLNQGRIGDTIFPSGNISITGSSTSLAESGNVVTLAVSTGQMYFTRNATDYEKQSVAWDLFEYGKETLASLAYPSYTFNVSSGNFMSMDEFVGFVRRLELGQRIYLNTDKNVLEPIFIGVEIDFENLSSLELKFSDKYSSSDSSFRLVELLDQSISMGKTVDTNKLTYSAFVESGASTKVKEFMDSALDVAKNAILSSTGQGVSWDDTGFHLRKYLDSSNQSAGFEDEEIWMINNSIVFTDDGWQTAKMAIGKIIDENIAKYPESSDIVFNSAKIYYFLNDDGNYQVWEGDESDWANRPILYEKNNTAYGIVAPYIVGTILAGQNLVITTETGDFRVDSSGVHIDSMRFYITHRDGSSSSFIDEMDSRDDTLAKDFSDALKELEGDLEEVADSQITTYYQADTPDAKVGDLWYVINKNPDGYKTNKLYRFNGTDWEEIEDADIVTAIEKANNAQATADGKIVSYYQAETPTDCGIGDIWYVTDENSDGFTTGKLYRYDGIGWNLVEDGGIQDVKDEISKTNQTLSEIIDAEGYLKADMMSGVIDSSKSQMQSATGNVLFDSDGIWLLNAAQKERATKAIWMNENGMLFGSGTASTDPANTWDWTTAINHDGIVADAIAAGKLSGMQIVGGSLNIGNGTFVVDSSGNLKATSGTFSGTVKGATFQDSSGNNMMSGGKFTSGYLDLSGINVGNGNFVVDSDGNVSMRGSITMQAGSSINWENVTESNAVNSAAYQRANNAYNLADSAWDYADEAWDYAGSAYEYAIDNAFNDEILFNALTNNGTKFGVFSAENGQLFINASYINSGTIDANLIKTGVLDAGLIRANNDIYIAFEDAVSMPSLWTNYWGLAESVQITTGEHSTVSYIKNNYPRSIYFQAYNGCIFGQTPQVYKYVSGSGYGLYDIITEDTISDYIGNSVAVFG